jgi:hypothetical protein
MAVPALESLFAEPWTAAARRVLPSHSPQCIATAIWGPAFFQCVLDLLAESLDVETPARTALDLFDRLRLREPLAHSFAALGLEGEASWRAAARIKVALLVAGERSVPIPEARVQKNTRRAKPGKKKTATPVPSNPVSSNAFWPAALWQDEDLRWLTGTHESEGKTYFVKECYEELLWWLILPVLRRLAAEAVPAHPEIAELSQGIKGALEDAADAEYRLKGKQHTILTIGV